MSYQQQKNRSDFIRKSDKHLYTIAISLLLVTILFNLTRLPCESEVCKIEKSSLASDIDTQPQVFYVDLQIEDVPFKTNETKTEIKSKSYYDTLSIYDIDLLEKTIQHEVGGFSKEYKKLVAELIYNRILSDTFPNTVYEVLFQNNQFCGIESWYYTMPPADEETKEVIKEVFSKSDTSHAAVYYYNPELSEYNSIIWFEYSGDVSLLFEYSETSWGVNYTTRFFI